MSGPNSLWHADRHHSLVNWGFVVHGAINAFSTVLLKSKLTLETRTWRLDPRASMLETFEDRETRLF